METKGPKTTGISHGISQRPEKPLTWREQQFVDHNLTATTPIEAVILAGYSIKTAGVTASKLMKKPNVKRAMEAAEEGRAKVVAVNAAWVLRGLMENFSRAMQYREALDREGNSLGVFIYRGDIANKALELIGRHLSMFPQPPTINIDNSQNQTLVLNGEDPQEVLRELFDMMKKRKGVIEVTDGSNGNGHTLPLPPGTSGYDSEAGEGGGG